MKKYKDDYEIVSSVDEKGNSKQTLAYRGVYFKFTPSGEELVRFKVRSLLMLVAIVVLHVSGGFIENQGMFQIYISLAYVFAYLALWYMASGMLRLPTKNSKYRRDEIELSLDRAKTASNILLGILGFGWLGELLFLLFFSAAGQRLPEYLYIGISTAEIILLYFLIRSQKKISVQLSADE